MFGEKPHKTKHLMIIFMVKPTPGLSFHGSEEIHLWHSIGSEEEEYWASCITLFNVEGCKGERGVRGLAKRKRDFERR